MNSRPEAPALSAATKAPGMMLVPGWVSMRKVSHLPPANAISALANAAPPFVTRVPFTMMVAPLRTPASSSMMSFTACCAVRRPRAEEHRREAVERDALGAIDHGGREIFVAQTDDPLRELPAERGHADRQLSVAPRALT